MLNSSLMYFTALPKTLLTAKSSTSPCKLLLKSNGSFEVVADRDLLWAFIYTEQVFVGTGQWLNADLYGYSHIKTKDLPGFDNLVPFGRSKFQFNWTIQQCLYVA